MWHVEHRGNVRRVRGNRSLPGGRPRGDRRVSHWPHRLSGRAINIERLRGCEPSRRRGELRHHHLHAPAAHTQRSLAAASREEYSYCSTNESAKDFTSLL